MATSSKCYPRVAHKRSQKECTGTGSLLQAAHDCSASSCLFAIAKAEGSAKTAGKTEAKAGAKARAETNTEAIAAAKRKRKKQKQKQEQKTKAEAKAEQNEKNT